MSKKQIAKILLALGIGVVTAASGVAVAGCGDNSGTGGGQQQEQPKTEYTVNFDLNGGSGTAPAAQKVESGEKLAAVTDPSHPDGLEFDGWWTAKEGGTKWNFETDTVTAGMTLFAHWKSKGGKPDDNPGGEIEFEDVTTDVPLTELWEHFGNSNKLAEDYTVGAVTFSAGVYFDSTGGITGNTVNNQKKKIWFDLQGSVNSIKFDAKGGSSFTLILYTEDGTEVKNFGTITSVQTGLVADELPAGKYYLLSEDGSGRLGNISYTQRLEKGTPASIDVKATEVDFLLNRQFGIMGVSATVTYTNGGTRAVNLTAENFDSSAVDMTKVGTYTVTVSYTENDETVHGSYDVNVYGADSIKLATSITNGNSQTNFNQVYKVGGTFSTAGLTVVANAKCGTQEKQFVLNADEYTANTPNLSAVGEVNFTVTAANKVMGGNTAATATLPIAVVGAATVENNTVTLSVDANKAVSATNFKTITDAIAYLGQLNLGADVVKVINIADGVYNEKVYINMPNVQLIGSDTVKPNHEKDNGVVIVYDAIAGNTDAAGHSYGTNGSATVTIGANATDFVAKNITFKNYYNTYELYQQSLQMSSDSQAVALYVDSTKATFTGCKLTSYHDTLYSNKGNHYYEQCWIEGHTDYIFGQDARAYFNDCDIFSIGAGVDVANGGYITALKPSNAASDYYFVYNNCRFDADENTKEGSVALGRAWGADMKMVVMNSTISAKFSTAAHMAGTGSAQRYCTMSGNEPKPGNMLEYNNTGDGAITASIENTCTVIDAAKAAAYDLDNLENIIGWNPAATYYTVTIHYGELTFTLSAKENSVLTLEQIKAALGGSYASYTLTGVYTDAVCQSAYDYEPINSTVDLYITLEEGEIIYDKTTTIDISDYEGTLQNATGKYKGIEIDATNGKVRGNSNSVQVNPGTIFKIHVNEGATVTVNYYQSYGSEGDITVSEVVDGVITLTVVDNGPSAGSNIYVVSFTVTYGSTTPQPGEGFSLSTNDAEANGWTVGEDKAGTNLKGLVDAVTDNAYFTVSTADNYYLNPIGDKAGNKATAEDGTVFTSGFVPTGNNKTLTITAKQDVTLNIYYTMTDGSWSDKSASLVWTVTGQGESGQSLATNSASVAYIQQITLKAGDVCAMTGANRLVLFAITVGGKDNGGEGNPDEGTEYSYEYKFEDIAATLDDPSASTVELTQANLTGANSWLTAVTSAPAGSPITGKQKLNYRGPNNNVLEIQKVALSFKVVGKATFKIKIGSTSSGNSSGFALLSANGTFVEGAITGGTAITGENGVYVIAGTSKSDELTYTLEEGTYYIVGYDVEYSRATRVYAMSLTSDN